MLQSSTFTVVFGKNLDLIGTLGIKRLDFLPNVYISIFYMYSNYQITFFEKFEMSTVYCFRFIYDNIFVSE